MLSNRPPYYAHVLAQSPVSPRQKLLDVVPKVREALELTFPSYDVVEFLGEGPILEQLQQFATASLIVAPHGAGLANMMVSPLHTPVLEIGPPGCPMCYVHLAIKVVLECTVFCR